MAARATPATGDPLDPAEGTVTAPCTPVADTMTVTVRGRMGSTTMQLAAGDGEGVAVLTVDAVVVVAVDGAGTAAEAAMPDEVVLDEVVLDEVVLVVHQTGAGFDTEIVAVPACAPSKLACMVPLES